MSGQDISQTDSGTESQPGSETTAQSQSSSLQHADGAAEDQSAASSVDSAAELCSAAASRVSSEETSYVIEALVVGTDDGPLADQYVRLVNDKDQVFDSVTDAQGGAKFPGLRAGRYRFSMYALDKEAWELLEKSPLAQDSSRQSGSANWAPASEPESTAQVHDVAEGECIASIAYGYGFYPDTLWDHPDNATLKAERESGYILLPLDRLEIPAKRIASIDVETGFAYTIRRKGVPEVLKIRFCDNAEQPRAGVPYLISMETAEGDAVKDVENETDANGFLIEPIHPDATLAKVTLAPGDTQECYELMLGHLDPIDTAGGVQARLNSLGYDCGREDGEIDAKTHRAIEQFQRENELDVTGEVDQLLKDKLQERYGS